MFYILLNQTSHFLSIDVVNFFKSIILCYCSVITIHFTICLRLKSHLWILQYNSSPASKLFDLFSDSKIGWLVFLQVKSKLGIISSYAEATDGLITHGWITKIEKHGCCFVRFYNGVQGFAPRLVSNHLDYSFDNFLSD